jgi:hypothetical protein
MTTETVTEATISDIINDAELTAENAEKLINGSVHILNIFGCDLTRLTGTAGSMSASWTSQQIGAVILVFRVLYASHYKNAGNNNVNISSLSVATTDLMSNPTAWKMIETIAKEIITETASDPPIYLSHDPIPT